MIRGHFLIALLLLILPLSGCVSPSERLHFPTAMQRTDEAWRYDVNGDGRADFALEADETGKFDLLTYDDDQNGQPDRIYRLSDYDPNRVPHVILILDSVPYRTVAARTAEGDWPWFDQPAKVIPPFPTMSGIIFSQILHAPPLPGAINNYYDRRTGKTYNGIKARAMGKRYPWHDQLNYVAKYWENGLAFLKPRRWYATELARAKDTVDDSPDRVTLLYIASSAGMLSRYGERGAQEVLDGIEPFCMQLLYERQGAIKITVLADHGHNYLPGQRVDLTQVLRAAGFHVTDHLKEAHDVVADIDGLVNYAGFHTRRAPAVATALAADTHVELAMYLQGERVMVRNAKGAAAVEYRDGSYRYVPLDGDPLSYTQVIDRLTADGHADAQGFIPADAWLAATTDHVYPDAPYRLWQAFHGLVVNTPDVMVTMQDGYCIGVESFQLFIDMASTHGGLNQINSATFVLSMTGRAHGTMRSVDILPTVEPGYRPQVRR